MDVLNLSQPLIKTLSSLSSFSPEQTGKLCRVFLQKLVLGTNANLDEKTADILDGIGALLLDAAKTRTTEAVLRTTLQEQGILGGNIDVIIAFYQQHQETITTYISKIGISFPQIVGIEWRLDYSIRAKNIGKENIPMFYISLKVLHSNTGSVEDKVTNINFIATLEELQDLLAKVKDAVKQVDRMLNTSD